MTTPLTEARYLQTKEKLARMAARLQTLDNRTDLAPVLRAEIERSYADRMRHYRHELKLYETAHPEVKALKPAMLPRSLPRPIGKTDLFQTLLEEGLIDTLPPPTDDAAADAFEPILIEGRPISEEIIEGRR